MSQTREPYQTRGPWAWKRILWLVGILLVGPPVILVLIHLIRIGYTHSWTGFGQSKVNAEIQPAKTMWDWLDLLIVPIVLAIGGYLFTRSETQATQAVAELRAQDDTLQAYLDRMAQLLNDKEQPLHKALPGDNLSTLARALTLTVLSTVDLARKRSVLEFLYETGLIYREQVLLDESGLIKRRHNIVNLKQANLRTADLGGLDLRGAYLNPANLEGADLSGANLSGANLRKAYLMDAYVSEEQVLSARSLEGAIMPNWQKYKDWLKDKEVRGEDRKNSDPS